MQKEDKRILQEEVRKLLDDLIMKCTDEEEVKKIRYLSKDFWDEINEKMNEAKEEAEILAAENDSSLKKEIDNIRREVRNYEVLINHKNVLQRAGYETFLKYRNK